MLREGGAGGGGRRGFRANTCSPQKLVADQHARGTTTDPPPLASTQYERRAIMITRQAREEERATAPANMWTGGDSLIQLIPRKKQKATQHARNPKMRHRARREEPRRRGKQAKRTRTAVGLSRLSRDAVIVFASLHLTSPYLTLPYLRCEVPVGVVAKKGRLTKEHPPNDLVGGVRGEPLQLGGQVALGAQGEEGGKSEKFRATHDEVLKRQRCVLFPCLRDRSKPWSHPLISSHHEVITRT